MVVAFHMYMIVRKGRTFSNLLKYWANSYILDINTVYDGGKRHCAIRDDDHKWIKAFVSLV